MTKTFLPVALLWMLVATVGAQTPPAAPGNGPATTQTAPSPAPAATPAIDPAKVVAIRKLLVVTGTEKTMRDAMSSMGDSIKPLLTSSLPAGEYRDKLVELFFEKFQSKTNIEELVNKLIPVYDESFSMEEIQGLLQFYQTPLGQKCLTALPKVLAEAGEIGKKWGQQLGRDAMTEVLEEHPDLKKALQDAGAAQRPQQ